MGRRRITLKRISNDRSRKNTFMNRKEGLVKKISEFCTMCGVEACLIVYDDDSGDVGPMTWPEDHTVVHSFIQNYEHQRNVRSLKTFDIQDFFGNRKNMVEAEITKVHKQITDIKYPTWDPSIRNMEEGQLVDFIAYVNAKIRDSDHRINILRNKHQRKVNFSFMQNMAQGSASSSNPSKIIHTPMEPLNDNNMWVDFANSMNQVDGACYGGINNMLRNMQHGDACFSYVPNMAQEIANPNATFSHTSRLNCLQHIFESQVSVESLKPLSVNNMSACFTNSMNQVHGPCNHGNNILRNIPQCDGCFCFVPSRAQESANATSSHPSQLNCLQNISQSQLIVESSEPLSDKNEMVDSSNQVDVPLDSTNSLESLEEFIEWANQLGDFEDLINQPIDWSNQLGGDLESCDIQTNVPIMQQNIPFQSQNVQQGGSDLYAEPPPVDGSQSEITVTCLSELITLNKLGF